MIGPVNDDPHPADDGVASNPINNRSCWFSSLRSKSTGSLPDLRRFPSVEPHWPGTSQKKGHETTAQNGKVDEVVASSRGFTMLPVADGTGLVSIPDHLLQTASHRGQNKAQ